MIARLIAVVNIHLISCVHQVYGTFARQLLVRAVLCLHGVQCVLVIRGELRQTLIGGTGSSALNLLRAHSMCRCGKPISFPI